ncbi:S9 family peptidase [Paenibacillus sp. UMB4589-SE434]|uniref:S9 family peptidase n=1 Tax=Paenibacillus sp. UMB4589-SE434 TaxID=3046314 RepID=UPI002550CEC7|nr:S9 family peptidase [Paenibacillus sp. UMB4589-SE434]MDK8181465.1 S9 family peptidase [Paenibacillus sp. UMB4589-SE434]
MIQFPKPEVEQYFQVSVIRQFTVNADESRIVFSSNMNGKFNLWAMEFQTGHPFPYPLTYEGQTSSFIKMDGEGRFVLTSLDRDGDENYHIYALPWNGGQALKLIEGAPDDKYFYVQMSEDGKRLYYVTSKDNSQFMNSRVYDLETKEDKLIHEGATTTTFLVSVSPDEQVIAYSQSYANTYMPTYVCRTGEEPQCVTPSADVVHVVGDVHFVDNDTVLFVTDYEQEYAYIAQYQLSTKQFKQVCAIEQESVTGIKWHKETRTLYVITEKGVIDKLYAYGYDSGEIAPISLPADIVEQISVAASGNIYVLARGATRPTNIYKYTEGAWAALTHNVMTGLSEEDLVDPDIVTYDSFDGTVIEALLYRAKEAVANGYTIFWPHGGPQAAERKQFRAMFQYLLAQGYHIFAPNFRGSTGYGSSFVKLVECDWGEGPRKDCLAGMEWLFAQEISSREKLFVFGGSYGGYMTLLLAGRHADYFRAAIDYVGVSNLFTFVNSVPEFWKPIMERWLGDPEKDKERFVKDSPITYLDDMTNPMLIVQGANDPRVVKEESDQIVEALRAKGRDVEYLVFEDEGHGVVRKENEKILYQAIVDFLKRHQ